MRPFLLLTGALVRRLAREGLIVRSLTFPPALVTGTLMLTVAVMAYLRSEPVVAIPPPLAEAGWEELLADRGFTPVIYADPRAAAVDEEAWAATDGHAVWLTGTGPGALALEALVREQAGAAWRPDADVPRPNIAFAAVMGRRIVILLGALFALYGVVFGAGMVARDRDEGILEVELAMAVPRWVHGAARWVAGSLGLALFLALGVAMVDAVMGVPDAWALVRHGVACACGSVAVGLLVIGRGGLKTGFTGPLAGGMTAVTGLFGLGAGAPAVAAWVPVASMMTDADGWAALAGALALGTAAVAVFTWRSTST